MPVITLTTEIKAPIEVCFDLSRSIDLHKHSADETKERAVDGVTSGLIENGQYVTWEAMHFGLWLSLTSEITIYERPSRFRDSMKRGPFKRFDHDHFFEVKGDITEMRDVFDFESPLGFLGAVVDNLFLKSYMCKFLLKRNQTIKSVAESNPGQFLSIT